MSFEFDYCNENEFFIEALNAEEDYSEYSLITDIKGNVIREIPFHLQSRVARPTLINSKNEIIKYWSRNFTVFDPDFNFISSTKLPGR